MIFDPDHSITWSGQYEASVAYDYLQRLFTVIHN